MNAALRSAVLKAGGLRVIRQLGSRGVRILLYHRFPQSVIPQLEKQCIHLRKHYNVVSLDEVDDWLAGQRSLPPNSLAVTVDDGYRDFFRTAYPVFRKYEIPVTVFLATAFLDRKCWLWVDHLEYLFQKTCVRSVDLPAAPGERTVFHLDSPELRAAAASAVKAAAKRMSNSEKLALIANDLPDRLQVKLPASPPQESEPLLWEEVRQMTSGGMSFGAHTQTHPILSSLATRQDLQEEILGSKLRIEQELGTAVRHFSYPNGTWSDITPEITEITRGAGFRSAVIAQGGVNFRNTDAFLLRRNTVEPQTPEVLFGKYATGFRRD